MGEYNPKDVLAGRFELIEKIGQGGMGQIWKATDKELKEDVALKMLSSDFAHDPICVRQLKNEIRRGRKLGHPHIVRLYELFSEDSDTVFITMEYVKGKNVNYLRAEQTDMSFGEEQVEEWTRQLCAALSFAHGEGVIHRDIKPSNILISNDKKVKLSDFGISVALTESATRVTRSTSGTPAYMSPEQIEGKSLTGASDLYSLGCSIFELLCGRPPFQGGSVDTVIRGHLEGHLPEPEEWPKQLSPKMSKLLQALIKPAPEERPSDAKQIIQYLDGDEKALKPIPVKPKTDSEKKKASAAKKESGEKVGLIPRFLDTLKTTRSRVYDKGESGSKGSKDSGSSFLKILGTFLLGMGGLGILLVLFLAIIGMIGLGAAGVYQYSWRGSSQNDEIFTPQRFDADFSVWKKQVSKLGGKSGLGALTVAPVLEGAEPAEPSQQISMWDRYFTLPVDAAVMPALTRRIPAGMQLTDVTVQSFEKHPDGVSVTYNVTVMASENMSLVPARTYDVPKKPKKSSTYKKLIKHVIFSPDLLAGRILDTEKAKPVIEAGKPIEITWTIRRAARVDGVWKVLDAEPLFFQQNSAFEVRLVKSSKNGYAKLLRSEGALSFFANNMDGALAGFEAVYAEKEGLIDEFRKEAYSKVPGMPKYNNGAGSGTPTKAATGAATGAAAGAGIGALAGGGDGAAIGAGVGAVVGLFGGLAKGTSDNRRKYNAAAARRRKAKKAADSAIYKYKTQIYKELESEMAAQAAAHEQNLMSAGVTLPVTP